jgi:hypothetical protein
VPGGVAEGSVIDLLESDDVDWRDHARSAFLTELWSIAGSRRVGIHFSLPGDLPELEAAAAAWGWPEVIGGRADVAWSELVWTRDGWVTTCETSSRTRPAVTWCDWFVLRDVDVGEEIEFALRIGLRARAAWVQHHEVVWLNSGGRNYRQAVSELPVPQIVEARSR